MSDEQQDGMVYTVQGIERLEAEIDRLRAENEKLRAALKPFAETADWDVSGTDTDNDVFRPILSPYNRAPVLRVAHLRAAAAALKETDNG